MLFIHFSTRRKRRLIKGAIRNLALLQKEKKKMLQTRKALILFFFKPSMKYHTVPWKNQSIHPRPTNQQEPYINKQVVYLTAWNKHVLH